MERWALEREWVASALRARPGDVLESRPWAWELSHLTFETVRVHDANAVAPKRGEIGQNASEGFVAGEVEVGWT